MTDNDRVFVDSLRERLGLDQSATPTRDEVYRLLSVIESLDYAVDYFSAECFASDRERQRVAAEMQDRLLDSVGR